MRTNNLSEAFKLVFLAVVAILVCIGSVLAIKTANEGKAMANAGTTQIKDMSQNYADIEMASYDGENLIGSALVDLIEDVIEEDKYISIKVKTNASLAAGACYNYTLSTSSTGNTITKITPAKSVPTASSDIDYINETAQFTGKVYKDMNKNIIAIEFTQMK
jgi:uncharacterized protein YceK